MILQLEQGDWKGAAKGSSWEDGVNPWRQSSIGLREKVSKEAWLLYIPCRLLLSPQSPAPLLCNSRVLSRNPQITRNFQRDFSLPVLTALVARIPQRHPSRQKAPWALISMLKRGNFEYTIKSKFAPLNGFLPALRHRKTRSQINEGTRHDGREHLIAAPVYELPLIGNWRCECKCCSQSYWQMLWDYWYS